MISLIEEPSISNTICDRILAKLAAEASLPVDAAIVRLSQSHPSSEPLDLSYSDSPPSLLAHWDTLDTCYTTWLALPIPSMSQLLQLSKTLFDKPKSDHTDCWLSVKLSHGARVIYLPTWVLKAWQCLRTMISRCQAWVRLNDTLSMLLGTPGQQCELAQVLKNRIPLLAFDSNFAQLSTFRTSNLPELICDAWLSEDHINAGVDYINFHPDCPTKLRIVNSYFMRHVQLSFQRHRAWVPGRWSALDMLIANGTINELLIPVHSPSHWTLLYVNIGTRRYAYCDTLNVDNCKAPWEQIDAINRWLACILHHNTLLIPSLRPFKLGPQYDSHSCGVAVLSSMAHYALGGRFSAWNPLEAKEQRLRWALHFLDFDHTPIAESKQLAIVNGTVTDLIDLENDYNPPLDIELSLDHPGTSEPSVDALHPLPVENNISLVPALVPIPKDKPKLTDRLASRPEDPQNPPTTSVSTHKGLFVQTKLPFQRVSLEEWQSQEKQRYYDRRQEKEDLCEHKKLMDAQKVIDKREYERLRKRAQWERKKQAKIAAGTTKRTSEHASVNKEENYHTLSRQEVSALSRPYSAMNFAATKPDEENSRKRKAEAAPMHRINWCLPLIWSIIERTARSVGPPFSSIEIVRKLQLIDPAIFGPLRPQRISQWRDHSTHPSILKWTDSHMRALEAGSRPTTGAKPGGIFEKHQDVLQEITGRLSDLRKAGAALTIQTIRGYMVGVIRHKMPDVLNCHDQRGNIFKCSDRFIRRFLHKELGWSVRKATRASQKHPPNVETVLLHAFLRFACVVHDEAIPACCIVNVDQTQVVYNPGTKTTWNTSGERQVHVVGAEDKRAFTLLVAASGSGIVLPFQAIYAGRSPRSLPSPTTPGYSKCKQLGFLLDFSETDTYWSTFKTMCRWVTDCLVPYFIAQRVQHGLPETQRCILQIDCWTVHRSARFRNWMAENYPWIILLYVPGGCTGLFQPCDVGLQRVLKLAIQNAAHNDIVEETLAALESGLQPRQILNDQALPTLHNRSISWILDGFRAINKPDVVKKAFALCLVPGTELNLSFESLTSHTARHAIRDLRTTNPELYVEITSGHHAPPPGAEEPDDIVDDEGDADHTVEEVLETVLNARTAAEAAGAIDNHSQFTEDGYESEDESVPLPCSKRPRFSSRHHA